ncbi:MAG: GAP family protein [Patescibacteria group bacterium]|nr:GAP family protein [Patescibacteria group bacterium]
MSQTLIQIIPFALAGAINPLGILIIISLLAKKDQPVKRAWLFLAGSILVLIAWIFLSHLILAGAFDISRQKDATSATIDIVLGAILIIWAIFKKNKAKQESQRTASFWKIFVAGVIFMLIIDVETIVFYLASMKAIFEAQLNFWQQSLVYIINIIIVMSTMAFPALVPIFFPNKAEKILGWLNGFFTKYGQLIGKIVILVIALYLLYLGLSFYY